MKNEPRRAGGRGAGRCGKAINGGIPWENGRGQQGSGSPSSPAEVGEPHRARSFFLFPSTHESAVWPRESAAWRRTHDHAHARGSAERGNVWEASTRLNCSGATERLSSRPSDEANGKQTATSEKAVSLAMLRAPDASGHESATDTDRRTHPRRPHCRHGGDRERGMKEGGGGGGKKKIRRSAAKAGAARVFAGQPQKEKRTRHETQREMLSTHTHAQVHTRRQWLEGEVRGWAHTTCSATPWCGAQLMRWRPTASASLFGATQFRFFSPFADVVVRTGEEEPS